MRKLLLFVFAFVYANTIFGQDLEPGIQMDEGNGQTFYTCDTAFFDSGGHYTHC